MKKYKLLIAIILFSLTCIANASSYNIAHRSKVTASSVQDEQRKASNVTDGIVRILNKGEWASNSDMTFWG